MAASYLMGFPWADNKDSSCAVYVVADSQELADKEAIRLAELMWSKKDEFCFQTETYHEQEASTSPSRRWRRAIPAPSTVRLGRQPDRRLFLRLHRLFAPADGGQPHR